MVRQRGEVRAARSIPLFGTHELASSCVLVALDVWNGWGLCMSRIPYREVGNPLKVGSSP